MLYPIIKSQITKVNNRKFLTQSPMQIQVIYFTLAKDKQQQSTAESILHNHTCKFNHSPSVILHPITKCQIAKVYNRKYCTHSLSHMQVQVLSHCYTAPSSLNGNIILIWCLLHIYLAAWMQCSLSPLMFTMHGTTTHLHRQNVSSQPPHRSQKRCVDCHMSALSSSLVASVFQPCPEQGTMTKVLNSCF